MHATGLLTQVGLFISRSGLLPSKVNVPMAEVDPSRPVYERAGDRTAISCAVRLCRRLTSRLSTYWAFGEV